MLKSPTKVAYRTSLNAESDVSLAPFHVVAGAIVLEEIVKVLHLRSIGDAETDPSTRARSTLFGLSKLMTTGSLLPEWAHQLPQDAFRTILIATIPFAVAALYLRFVHVPSSERAVKFSWHAPDEIRRAPSRRVEHWRGGMPDPFFPSIQIRLDLACHLEPFDPLSPRRHFARADEQSSRRRSIVHHGVCARVWTTPRDDPFGECARDSRQDLARRRRAKRVAPELMVPEAAGSEESPRVHGA